MELWRSAAARFSLSSFRRRHHAHKLTMQIPCALLTAHLSLLCPCSLTLLASSPLLDQLRAHWPACTKGQLPAPCVHPPRSRLASVVMPKRNGRYATDASQQREPAEILIRTAQRLRVLCCTAKSATCHSHPWHPIPQPCSNARRGVSKTRAARMAPKSAGSEPPLSPPSMRC